MTMVASFLMLPMLLGWFAGIILLVAAVLAVYFYVAGKDEEYRRAKVVAVKMFCIVLTLIVLGFLYLMPVRG